MNRREEISITASEANLGNSWRGYSIKDVDSLLSRIKRNENITKEEIESSEFAMMLNGYDFAKVDALLDRIIEILEKPKELLLTHPKTETLRDAENGYEKEQTVDAFFALERSLKIEIINKLDSILKSTEEKEQQTLKLRNSLAREVNEAAQQRNNPGGN